MAKYYVVEHIVKEMGNITYGKTTLLPTRARDPLHWKNISRAVSRAADKIQKKTPAWTEIGSKCVALIDTTMNGNHRQVIGLGDRNVRDLHRE